MEKYNALFMGMKIAQELSIHNLEVYDDLLRLVNQVCREFEVQHIDLMSYHSVVIQMMQGSENFHIEHIP